MKDFMVMESQLSNLPPRRRKQAEKLLGLVKRVMEEDAPRYLYTPEDVYLMASDLMELDKEHFMIIMLNSKNRMVGKELISMGGLNQASVCAREVFKPAISKNAAVIVCVHNHPSGDPTPSETDISWTKRIVNAGEILGIEVVDHIVVGTEGYVSLKEQGII
ncbi:JAB domain-containing protein [Paenibacillus senegalimassiliensis]|uniref:JAB domain-containing protein n=1 Tax=Paenibacillus senegalimassiliensis TaxID=1737426 RepID=UPI00073F4DBC|nr:DNA repair protein RadC [Paenibacillus senegalimassiliensis]